MCACVLHVDTCICAHVHVCQERQQSDNSPCTQTHNDKCFLITHYQFSVHKDVC